MLGRVLKVLLETDYPAAGTYTVSFNSDGLPAGMYYARFQNGIVQHVLPMVKVR